MIYPVVQKTALETQWLLNYGWKTGLQQDPILTGIRAYAQALDLHKYLCLFPSFKNSYLILHPG
jgi:hypothetical protein